MWHSPAHPFVTAVLLYVCYPLFTLSHDLHSFQVKMFVDDLEENIQNERTECSLCSKNHILQQYKICKTSMSLTGYGGGGGEGQISMRIIQYWTRLQIHCGISVLGVFQDPTGKRPEEPGLNSADTVLRRWLAWTSSPVCMNLQFMCSLPFQRSPVLSGWRVNECQKYSFTAGKRKSDGSTLDAFFSSKIILLCSH